MKRETISKGVEITTEEGYLIITGYNGHIVYADHHKQTWPEDATEFTDDNATEFVEKDMMTLSNLAMMMKAVDGKNHDLRWEGDRW